MTFDPVVIRKGQVDSWLYRSIALKNDIRVLLVSDPAADKAAAAVDVHVGSIKDGHLPGLAHFTEHMLFYSSEKYPREDEFSKWVSDHGGSSNAYTAAEHTCYHFAVNYDALESTLDRFAQFFVAPLISVDGIERERNAVSSEHDGNINNDAWRQMQLWKLAGNQAHPYTRFFTGNLVTLRDRPEAAGVDVHAAVVQFHREHYSANRMTLVVMGRDSLDELQAIVERTFCDVPNKGLPVSTSSDDEGAGDIYGAEQVGKIIYALPMNDGHKCTIKWVIPPQLALWREGAALFLGHLIGHEGKGSLFALLKDKGWAKSLSAGDYSPIASTSLFSINLSLTDAGQANIQEVCKHCFQYIALLRQPGGLSEALFDDNKALRRLAFDFRENPKAGSYAPLLANMMHDYPVEHVLEVAYHVPQAYDEAATRAVLDCLTPERAIMLCASKSLEAEATETEEWYGQRYRIAPIPAEWLESWDNPGSHPALHLPEINPFTPTNLALCEEAPPSGAADEPVQLCGDAMVAFWYKTHLEFRAPKASLRMRFILPAAFTSPEAYMATALYKALLASSLNELAYPAELAGLHYSVSMQTGQAGGLQVNMGGYSSKLIELLRRVAAQLSAFTVTADELAVEKERYRDNMQNRDRQPPYRWCLDNAELLLNTDGVHTDDTLAALPGLGVAEVQRHVDHVLFQHARVEGLVIGNADEAMAADIVAVAREVLAARGSRPIAASVMDRARLVRLPRAASVKWSQPGRNAKDVNSAHLSLYQVDKQHDIKAAAMASLVDQVCSRDAFHELRTVQQIGYVVHMYSSPSHGVPHLGVLLQSSTLNPAQMDAAVAQFLRTWRAGLEEKLTDAVFQEHVEELAKSMLEKAQNLGTYVTRWFREICIARFAWDIVERCVAELRTVTRAELLEYIDATFGAAQARLTIDICGAGPASDGQQAENGDAGQGSNGVARGAGEMPQNGDVAGVGKGDLQAYAAVEDGEVTAGEPDNTTVGVGAASADVQNGVQAPGEVAVRLVDDWARFRKEMALWPAHRQAW